MGKHSIRMILKGATPESLARTMARTAIERKKKYKEKNKKTDPDSESQGRPDHQQTSVIKRFEVSE